MARLAMTTIAASSAPHATPLYELVRRVGGALTIDVYPDIAAVAVSVPAGEARSVLRAMMRNFSAPSVSEAGRKRALQELGVDIAARAYQPDMQARDRAFGALFASGPAVQATLPASAAALEHIGTGQIRAFAARAFRPQNAIVTLAGKVDVALLDGLAVVPAVSELADAPFDSAAAANPIPHPAPSSPAAMALAWAGPGIEHTRETIALDAVANALFDERTGSIALLARRLYPDLTVTGQFITMHSGGVFLVTVAGPHPERLRGPIESGIAELATPMSPAQFSIAHTIFEYRTNAEYQTPDAQARALGWYAAEGQPQDAPGVPGGTYESDAAQLDAATVAAVVLEYLGHPAVAYALQPAGEGP